MKRRRKIWIIVACIVVASVTLSLLQAARYSVIRLRVVRQDNDPDLAVVFFKLTWGGSGDMQILNGELVSGNGQYTAAEWMTKSVMHNPKIVGKEFGVLAPTTGSPWKLRLTISMENRTVMGGAADMPRAFSVARQGANRKPKDSLVWQLKGAWMDTQRRHRQIESDWITNRLSPPAFGTNAIRP